MSALPRLSGLAQQAMQGVTDDPAAAHRKEVFCAGLRYRTTNWSSTSTTADESSSRPAKAEGEVGLVVLHDYLCKKQTIIDWASHPKRLRQPRHCRLLISAEGLDVALVKLHLVVRAARGRAILIVRSLP